MYNMVTQKTLYDPDCKFTWHADIFKFLNLMLATFLWKWYNQPVGKLNKCACIHFDDENAMYGPERKSE